MGRAHGRPGDDEHAGLPGSRSYPVAARLMIDIVSKMLAICTSWRWGVA